MKDYISQKTAQIRIFLCHSSGDKEKVRELHRQLLSDNFKPWLDEEDLLPGQEWRSVIPKVVRASDIVLVCLSNGSVSKTGYVQKEIVFALDVADEKPEGITYIIPVRLEECNIPDRLERWQAVDLFKENGYEKLVRSLRAQQELNVNKETDSTEKLGNGIDNITPSHVSASIWLAEEPYPTSIWKRESYPHLSEKVPGMPLSVASYLFYKLGVGEAASQQVSLHNAIIETENNSAVFIFSAQDRKNEPEAIYDLLEKKVEELGKNPSRRDVSVFVLLPSESKDIQELKELVKEFGVLAYFHLRNRAVLSLYIYSFDQYGKISLEHADRVQIWE